VSLLLDALRAISELLLGPAEYALGRQHDAEPHAELDAFLDLIVGKYANEGVRRTSDALILMLRDSCLAARHTTDPVSKCDEFDSPYHSVERVAPRLGWAFTIGGGTPTDVKRLTEILDTELENRLLKLD